MKTALIILAQEGYQDTEFAGTRDGLLSTGFEVVIASEEAGTCTGKLGGSEQADISMRDVNVHDYDRIAFIGGPGAVALAANEDALRIAKETAQADKVLGAICIAPIILAKAGVLQGKKATVWDSEGVQAAILQQAGVEYTGASVTVDGLIVTGNGPHAAEEFGKTLSSL